MCSLFDSSFDLQPRSVGGECTDYVAIFHKQLGKDAGVVLEAKICGSTLPDSMQIEESSMTVQFVSDSIADSHSGFSLHYETNFKEGKFFETVFMFIYVETVKNSWNCPKSTNKFNS